MRVLVYVLGVLLVVTAAFASYRTSYQTQDLVESTQKLRREIHAEREALAVLRAEWAYLNAPERLASLAARHQAALGLGPMTAERFGMLAEVAPPQPDDGMEPVPIIGLDDVAPPVGVAPSPPPRPVSMARP